MRSRGGMVWLVCGALVVTTFGAEPAAAPLADSKKALDALRKDQRDKTDPVAGKLRDLLPTIETPGAPPAPTDFSSPPQSDKLPKNKERKENWLLNGMDKLDATKKSDTTNRRRSKSTADETSVADPDEPTDLLGLYSEQQKQGQADRTPPPAKLSAPDPLAPFLQNWLSGSPVRGQFFDETLRRSEVGGGGERSAPAAQADPRGPAPSLLADLPGFRDAGDPASSGAPSSNPYLRVMAMPTPEAHSGQPPASPPADLAAPVTRSLPPALPSEKKAPAAPPADDRKYFPQLRKF